METAREWSQFQALFFLKQTAKVWHLSEASPKVPKTLWVFTLFGIIPNPMVISYSFMGWVAQPGRLGAGREM
jgi:hypothetical protein